MSVVRKIRPFLGAALLCAIAVAGFLAWQGGYRLYIVHTGSMTPTILAGDAVLDGPPKATYHPGDIITFRHSDRTTDLVTHSVIDVKGGKIHTKGDANRTADVWDIRPDQVQGVVIRRFPRMGYLLTFLRQPSGIAAVVIGGLALIVMWRLLSPGAKEETGSESAQKQAPSSSPTRLGGTDPAATQVPEPPAKAQASNPSA